MISISKGNFVKIEKEKFFKQKQISFMCLYVIRDLEAKKELTSLLKPVDFLYICKLQVTEQRL